MEMHIPKAKCLVLFLLASFILFYFYSPSEAVYLTSPNGGEILASGESFTIQWIPEPGEEGFKLEYSVNNGQTWKLISENVTGIAYDWTAPSPRGNKGKCRVKITAYNSRGRRIASDRSSDPFRIEALRLISPDGGNVLGTGDVNLISWQVNNTASEVSRIVLYYSLDDGVTWKVITNEVPADSSYFDWSVPRFKGIFRRARIKIVLKDFGDRILASDQCNGPFTITDGRTHIYETRGGALSVDYVHREDKVTELDWGCRSGTPDGRSYTYRDCPSGEPVQGFRAKGKNLTSGTSAEIENYYSAKCGYFFCWCETQFTACFPLVMGYNILSIRAWDERGASTTVLETFKKIPFPPTGVAALPGNEQNTITWDEVPEATSYNIYWSETYPVTKAEANRIPRVLSPYIHSGLTNGKTYYYLVTYMVTAGGANIESHESLIVSGTPE